MSTHTSSRVIDEEQKTFLLRDVIPKDIKQEFLTGQRKFDEIMEKLEIIVNDMMADDGPVPMDLRNVGTHDAKMTQSDSDTSNDMSHDDVCDRFERVQRRQGNRQERTERIRRVQRGKGVDEWTGRR